MFMPMVANFYKGLAVRCRCTGRQLGGGATAEALQAAWHGGMPVSASSR
jgi:hypothetical protein